MAPSARRSPALSSTPAPWPSAPPMAKTSSADAVVPPPCELLGEGAAVEVAAALVEGDEHGPRRQRGEERCGFLVLAQVGGAGAALGELADGKRQAELAAGLADAVDIALGKLAFRTGLHAADRGDGHRASGAAPAAPAGQTGTGSVGWSASHIFSIL